MWSLRVSGGPGGIEIVFGIDSHLNYVSAVQRPERCFLSGDVGCLPGARVVGLGVSAGRLLLSLVRSVLIY